ncbi:arsenate reductase (glutaredoxin) [Herbaspirillum seropedicae]|nr:arsenate reductase (glutaredoxin) [Herbaspirillum sp. alder98]
MSDITLYHNPKCGTSRNVLQALRDAGVEPTVIEYLKTPPGQATLTRLIADMSIPVREVIRSKEAIYIELGLDDPSLSDAQLIAKMVEHPILINRPIVVTPKGTLLARPKERLAEVFP